MPSLLRRTAASVLAFAALVAAGSTVPAAAAPPSPLNYVNFGDSYSAGWGAYPPTAGQNPNITAAPCPIGGRPDQVTMLAHLKSVTLSGDYACAGATVSAEPSIPGTPTIAQQAMLAASDGKLNPSTGLVTLTAGGNDVGFADFVRGCAADRTPSAVYCQALAAQGLLVAESLNLAGTIGTIRGAAANAQIVWLGYPHLFAQAGEPTTVVAGGGVLSPAAATVAAAATDQFNAILADKARAAGATFVDVTAKFDGHEIGSSDPWINMVPPTSPLAPFNLHPTATGYANGYYPAMVSQIKPAQLVRP
ncbi:SGNH family lipase [Sinomonas notoginsengisoli]|uniref:SGNH/GDSL hydrolase family protein n=1 Tax=Sinomonas notoginsengisoli TaxID=1457311 RepID=UPI001F2C78E9|nr:SGNH/GDSL hydrolase family protein [Sinomonas notoginsengisoli]